MSDNTKQRIITEASELFKKYGIKRITVDDIAKHLGISKKTLYLHFADKKDLVTVCTRHILETEQKVFDEIKETSKDAIEEITNISVHLKKVLRSINPVMLYDLKRFYSSGWSAYCNYTDTYIKDSLTDSLEKGIAQGVFRKEMNVEIIAKMRMEQMQTGFDLDIFPLEKFDFSEVQMQLLDHFIHGIITLKGFELMQQYKQQDS
jgi:AcrR family transcriptional regulator